MSVFRVAVENITPLWPKAEPLVVKALNGRPTHLPEDVRKMLMAQMCQLWAQWHNGDGLAAIVVSEFASYPQGVWVRAWLGAAQSDARMDFNAFSDALLAWGEMHKCRGLEAQGRHGWLKRYPTSKTEGLLMRVTI